MTRESLVFILGIIVIIIPYSGITENWKLYILTGCGALLMVTGYSLRRSAYLRSLEHQPGERRGDSFVEHVHPASDSES